jgi:hypothetical protein
MRPIHRVIMVGLVDKSAGHENGAMISAERSDRMTHKRSLAATASLLLLLVLSLLGSSPANAGGDYFTAEVLDFQDLGRDEYRLMLRQLTPLYASEGVPTNPIVIYLRHDEAAIRRGLRDAVSKEEFVAAIALLKQQIAQSTTIQLGVMGGSGLAPIDGKPGEFQCNSLTVEDGVVVAWNGAVS